MVILLGFVSALVISILSLIACIFTFYVVLPLTRMSFYKAKGRPSYFFPVIGYLKPMAENVDIKKDVMADAKEFGQYTPEQKVFVTNTNSRALVVLRDSAYIKEHISKNNCYEKAYIAQALLPLMGTGLVLAEGDTWKRHRKIISNSFHYEFLKTNVSTVQRLTREYFDKITPEDHSAFSAIARVQDITGEVVGRIFFGENLAKYTFEGKPLTVGLAELVSELGFCGRSPFVILFGTKIMTLPIIPKFKSLWPG